MALQDLLRQLGFNDATNVHPAGAQHPLHNHTPVSAALNIISGNFKIGNIEEKPFGREILRELVNSNSVNFLTAIPAYGNNNAIGLAALLGLINEMKLMAGAPEANPNSMKGIAGGYNPLTFASINAKTDGSPPCPVIPIVVGEYNIDPDQLNPAGDTALQLAACHNALGGVRALLAEGANVNLPFTPTAIASPMNTGRTPFMLACNGHRMTMLAKNGELMPQDSFVPVAIALNVGQLNVNLRSADDSTYLHYAAMTNDSGLMNSINGKHMAAHPGESLVNVPNSSNVQNINYGTLVLGATPLNAAAFGSTYSLPTVQKLVEMGSEVNGHFTTALKTGNAHYHVATSTNFTAACQGAYYSDSAVIKAEFVEKAEYFLKLESFTNYHFTDSDGFNSIHWSVSLGSAKLLHILFEKIHDSYGEEVFKGLLNAKDSSEKTALDWAIENWQSADAMSKQEHIDILTEFKAHGASFQDAPRSLEMTAILTHAALHHEHNLLPSYAEVLGNANDDLYA